MYRNREILQKMADDLVCNAEKLRGRITETVARLSNFKRDPYQQVNWAKTNLSACEEFLGQQTSRAKKSNAEHLRESETAQTRLVEDWDPDEAGLRLQMEQAESFIALNAAALRSQIQTVKENIAEVAAESEGINTDAIGSPMIAEVIIELKSQVQTLNERASEIAKRASEITDNFLEQFEKEAASSATIRELTCLLFEVAQSPSLYGKIGLSVCMGEIRYVLDSELIKVYCYQTRSENEHVLLEKIANTRRQLANDEVPTWKWLNQ